MTDPPIIAHRHTVRGAKRDWLGKGINDDSLPHTVTTSFGKLWATRHLGQPLRLQVLYNRVATMPDDGAAGNVSEGGGRTIYPHVVRVLRWIAVWIAILAVVGWVYGPTAAVIPGICLLALLVLWQFPAWVAARYSGLESKARFDIENESRKTLAQIMGGAGVIAGIYLTGMTFALSRDSQIVQRFATATQQLGALDKDSNPIQEVRMAGIYSLERIAQDSERDHWAIMELLSAYVRARAPWPPKVFPRSRDCSELHPDLDVQAALTVIGRRTQKQVRSDISNGRIIDLHSANLMGADFRGAHLELSDLSRAVLFCADLSGARLNRANLFATILWATVNDADFTDAKFSSTDLRRTRLKYVKPGTLTQQQTELCHCKKGVTELPEGLSCPDIEAGGLMADFKDEFKDLEKSAEARAASAAVAGDRAEKKGTGPTYRK